MLKPPKVVLAETVALAIAVRVGVDEEGARHEVAHTAVAAAILAAAFCQWIIMMCE